MTGFGSSCGACRFLRRRCSSDCVFAPYFSYDEATSHFAAVHKVFGASNVSKLLLHLPVHTRREATVTISYEALARMQDPIYGCVAHIFALEQQVASLREEIEIIGAQMAAPTYDCQSYQKVQDPDVGMQIHSDFIEMNNDTYCSDQQTSLPYTEMMAGNQAFYGQINEQLPPIYGWADDNCDLNISDILIGEIDQEIYSSYPWIATGSNGNCI